VRILVVTSQFPIAGEPTRGRPILQTVRELAKLATVRVLSPVATYPRWAQPKSYLFRAPERESPVEGIDTEYVSYPALPAISRPFNGALCARAIRASVERYAPDAILSYWLYPDAWGAHRVARRFGIPFVAGARGSDIRVRDRISRLLTRSVVRDADRLLVVSADLGRLAAEQYGADPSRVRVIPNGCDAATFHLRDRAEARAALGIASDAELIVYVGRLVPEKGLRELLDAMATLAQTHPRATLALVGEGPMRATLEAAASGALNGRVRLVGVQPPDVVATWMAASDLVTLPSYSEGHPNVLVEALACGRPVVATPVGGIPEVVDPSCSLIVPPRDSAALAVALRGALEHDWDAQALSRRFSRDWAEVARETLVACEEACASHAKTARATT
jgi:glycosyltransferase involved in cell wall biosynthesis